MTTQQVPHKKLRGFAAWPQEKRLAAARLGGIRAHELGVAHEWSRPEAKAAGHKGGQVTRARALGERVVSVDVMPLNLDVNIRAIDRVVQRAESGDADAIAMLLGRSAA